MHRAAAGPPGRPTTVVRKTDMTIIVSWDRPKYHFNVPIQYHHIQFREKADGKWEDLKQGDRVKEMSTLADDLHPSVEYFFRVRAKTAFGWSAFSDVSRPIITTRYL